MTGKLFQRTFLIFAFFLTACGGGGDGGEAGGPINTGTLGTQRNFQCTCTGSCDPAAFGIQIDESQENLVLTGDGADKTFIRRGEEPGFIVIFANGSETLSLSKGIVDDPNVSSGVARYHGGAYNCVLQ